MPAFSPTRRVSSTVAALQASSPANSRIWRRWRVTELAASPRTRASASTTAMTKASSQSGSVQISQSGTFQIGQARTPLVRSWIERTEVCLAVTSTLNLRGGRHVPPSVPDCRDIGCRTSKLGYSTRLLLVARHHLEWLYRYSARVVTDGAPEMPGISELHTRCSLSSAMLRDLTWSNRLPRGAIVRTTTWA